MSKFYARILVTGLICMFVLAPVYSAKALTIENAENSSDYRVSQDTEDDLVVINGNNVTVEGDVNGDLMVFANKVLVMGNVEGNVYAMGNEVDVRGMVGKSLYAFGGTVTVRGEVVRDVFAGAERVTVNGRVMEDLNAAGAKVFVNSSIGDGLRAAARNVVVNDDVSGDAILLTDNSQVNGAIGGNIYRSEDFYRGGMDWGDFRRDFSWDMDFSGFFLANLGLKLLWAFFQSIGYILVGILLFKFAPIRIEETVSRMDKLEDFFKSTLVGFLAFPVGTMFGVVLALSLFGWPLLKVLVLLALLVTSLVTPIAGIWIGRELLVAVGSKRRYIVAVTLGVLVIQMIKLIPIVGWIFAQLLTFAVVGAMLRMQWSKYRIAQNLSIKMGK